MSTQAVSELRLRMIEDMKARQLNQHTQRSHIYSCKRFAAYLKHSPATATADEVRAFQLYLMETGPSICNRNRMYGRRPPCKRNLTFLRCDRVRSCMRPIGAASLAAGHDVIRGSGPNQGGALFPRVALGGFSRSNGSTVSHHVVFTPAIRDATLT